MQSHDNATRMEERFEEYVKKKSSASVLLKSRASGVRSINDDGGF